MSALREVIALAEAAIRQNTGEVSGDMGRMLTEAALGTCFQAARELVQVREALDWLLHIVRGEGKEGGVVSMSEAEEAVTAGDAALALLQAGAPAVANCSGCLGKTLHHTCGREPDADRAQAAVAVSATPATVAVPVDTMRKIEGGYLSLLTRFAKTAFPNRDEVIEDWKRNDRILPLLAAALRGAKEDKDA